MTKNKILGASFFFTSIVLALPSLAQPKNFQPMVFSPDEEINRKISEYVISSSKDRSVIPDSDYYRFIFTNIQQDPPSYLTTSDWTVIADLPSHFDAQFTEENYSDIENACAALKANSSVDETLAIALRMDDADAKMYRKLDDHYKKVLASLSKETQTEIQKEKTRLSGTRVLGYSTFDMSGLAAELPEIASKMMANGCANLSNLEDQYKAIRKERLIDVEPDYVQQR